MFWIGRLRWARSELARWEFLRCLKNYLTWFNRIFLISNTRKYCVFQIFLLGIIQAHLCPNIINFDALDFSERRPEEVMFLLTLSVYSRKLHRPKKPPPPPRNIGTRMHPRGGGGSLPNNLCRIDRFGNVFKFYAYLSNKGCSWQPECLSDIVTSNVCKLDSKHWGSFMKSRLMEKLVTRCSEKKCA